VKVAAAPLTTDKLAGWFVIAGAVSGAMPLETAVVILVRTLARRSDEVKTAAELLEELEMLSCAEKLEKP
jgi:hypothetical protein